MTTQTLGDRIDNGIIWALNESIHSLTPGIATATGAMLFYPVVSAVTAFCVGSVTHLSQRVVKTISERTHIDRIIGKILTAVATHLSALAATFVVFKKLRLCSYF